MNNKKRNRSYKGGMVFPFIYMIVDVEVRDNDTDELVHQYQTDLADTKKRQTFAQQMSESYAANQYSIVSPVRVQRRIS